MGSEPDITKAIPGKTVTFTEQEPDMYSLDELPLKTPPPDAKETSSMIPTVPDKSGSPDVTRSKETSPRGSKHSGKPKSASRSRPSTGGSTRHADPSIVLTYLRKNAYDDTGNLIPTV